MEGAMEDLDHHNSMSDVSSWSSEPIFDPEVFREHLETRYEITDLDVAQRQLRVLSEHIALLRATQSNGTVTEVVPTSYSTKCLTEENKSQASVKAQEDPIEETGEDKKVKWSSFFVNTLASQGMALDYIPPSSKRDNLL